MSSLFQQAETNSTDKPALTKYGHTAPGPGSGLDENPKTRSAEQPQGNQKAGAAGDPQAGTIKTSAFSRAARTQGGDGEEEIGIEHFQP